MYVIVQSNEAGKAVFKAERATFPSPTALRTRKTGALLSSYEVISPSSAKVAFIVFVVQIPRDLQMTVTDFENS
jgi:hypothetical protein